MKALTGSLALALLLAACSTVPSAQNGEKKEAQVAGDSQASGPLLRAKALYDDGDFLGSRDLCESALTRDLANQEAAECLARASRKLQRLGKEAYQEGYVYESLKRIDEAKKYWNRATLYLQPGDEYFEKAAKKLEEYRIASASPVRTKGRGKAGKGVGPPEAVRSLSMTGSEGRRNSPEAGRKSIEEKRQQAKDLLGKATQAMERSHFQEAIEKGSEARRIEIPGETAHVTEADDIIKKARLKQREEFESHLINARGWYAEGQFHQSRDLCEEMLKKDPSFTDARECSLKAGKMLNKLAQKAYQEGIEQESTNHRAEAYAAWERAKLYVRPGDPYYERVMKKLDQYK